MLVAAPIGKADLQKDWTPVIYTCEKRAWEAEKTHFDTNHLTTVIWDKNDLATAEQQLTAIIRNTLPDAAKMDD